MSFYRRSGKRLCDMVLALAGLCVLWPIFILVAVLVKADSPGPALFRQVRTGRDMRPFRIVKFRTMTDAAYPAEAITVADDRRLTRLGRFLRASKLDELPQLWNVICGEMSIVGPRPELEYFVLHGYSDEERRAVFSVRPGLIDCFAIRSIDEEEIPANEVRPVDYYLQTVLPAKIKAHLEYVKAISPGRDVELMVSMSLALIRKPFTRRTRTGPTWTT
jgi:lipopolysaccharide/colanic/teichoic acid biosynthesis glycosyltransferase